MTSSTFRRRSTWQGGWPTGGWPTSSTACSQLLLTYPFSNTCAQLPLSYSSYVPRYPSHILHIMLSPAPPSPNPLLPRSKKYLP